MRLNLNINIGIEKVEKTDESKLLGLLIDINLRWCSHVDNNFKNNSDLIALRRMSFLCSESTSTLIFHTHIQSHIAYGIAQDILTNFNQNINIAKKAFRIILKLQPTDSAKWHFHSLGVLTVFGLYILSCIMYVRENPNN